MSRFLEAVKAGLDSTDIVASRRPLLIPELEVSKDFKPHSYEHLARYRVSVTYGVTGHCYPDRLQSLYQNVVDGLRREIYGDLQRRIIRLERAVLEQDDQTALSELRDIKKEIFG